MILRSTQFDDIYFSPENGLAETKFVFLDGNDLPARWQEGGSLFTIAETGFGTGLNFLAAWDLFERTTGPDQKLHFISIEKYPLDKTQIREALAQWKDELGDKSMSLHFLYLLCVMCVYSTENCLITKENCLITKGLLLSRFHLLFGG